MSPLRLHRAAHTRPRLVLGLVLASTLGALRPSVDVVAHCHANGERAHVHLGDARQHDRASEGDAASLLGAAGVAREPSSSHANRRSVVRAAGRAGLHLHLARPVLTGRLPALAAVEYSLRVTPWTVPSTAHERLGFRVRGHARAPPRIPA